MRLIVSLITALVFSTAAVHARTTPQLNCIANLRQIDGAKSQMAVEKRLRLGEEVDITMLATEYLRGQMPQCPAGGTYTIGPIGVAPVCSVPGHSESDIRLAIEQQSRRARIIIGCILAGGAVVAAWVVLSVRASRNRSEIAAIPVLLSTLLALLAPSVFHNGSQYRPAGLVFVGWLRDNGGDWKPVVFIGGYMLVYFTVSYATLRIALFVVRRRALNAQRK